eukprot:scaffold76691_cov71-Phaeocystis_antarctica.AAC.1
MSCHEEKAWFRSAPGTRLPLVDLTPKYLTLVATTPGWPRPCKTQRQRTNVTNFRDKAEVIQHRQSPTQPRHYTKGTQSVHKEHCNRERESDSTELSLSTGEYRSCQAYLHGKRHRKDHNAITYPDGSHMAPLYIYCRGAFGGPSSAGLTARMTLPPRQTPPTPYFPYPDI